MHPLSGKVVGVTGAGSGIGLATSRLLASHGAILSLADIDEESLEKAEEILSTPGVRFITSLVDICSSDDITAWLYKTETELGPLFGAVNCAGVSLFPFRPQLHPNHPNAHRQRSCKWVLPPARLTMSTTRCGPESSTSTSTGRSSASASK